MKKCICIPVEQYELMLETYDKVVDELEKMKKKPLKKLQLLQRQSNPDTHKSRICLDYMVYPAKNQGDKNNEQQRFSE